jgi:hypothetical protein
VSPVAAATTVSTFSFNIETASTTGSAVSAVLIVDRSEYDASLVVSACALSD